jgi:imidazole glycerol-phosphate synthase subunit HisH
MSVALIDLGYGNIGSIEIALKRLGAEVTRTADPAAIRAAERVILPGVGAAGYAMGRIDALGLRDTLTGLTQPLLGICLGMQLLFEASEEDGAICLGLIPGKVRRLDPAPGRPVPHMGWSRLETRADTPGLATGDYVYFAHSFACDDGPHSLAVADNGRPVPAAVRKGNVLGAQFHPERSSAAGARFMEAFLAS